MSWEPELEELRRREELARRMGGEERVARQHDSGRLTVRERIERLFDAGSFHETGALAGRGAYGDDGELTDFLPANTIVGQGRLLGEAVVDLDAVSRANPPKGLLDPMRLLTGRLPVRVQGVLTTSRGTGKFDLESAHIAGMPVPKSLLQTLVSFYSKSADHPQGVGLDDPFELPAAIREIRVEPGQAIVVQ